MSRISINCITFAPQLITKVRQDGNDNSKKTDLVQA